MNFKWKSNENGSHPETGVPRREISARLRNFLKRSWAEGIGLILLFLTLLVAVNSIQQAQWISPQPSLKTVLLLSMVLAAVMAKIGWRLRWKVAVSGVGGVLVTIWQITSVLPSPAASSIIGHFTGSMSILWTTLQHSTPSEGTIYFALFLVVLTWVLGYLSSRWFVRKQSIWPAIFLGLIALLVNLDYLSQSAYGYFFLYIFVAVVLVSFVSFTKMRLSFKPFRIKYPLRSITWFIAAVLILSAILVGVSWMAPEIRANQLQTLSDTKVQIGKRIDDLKINLFAPVKAKGAIIKNADQNVLYFSSPPDLSTDVQFNILASQPPSYWRVRRYDIYNSFGWSISPYNDSLLETGKTQKQNATPAARSQLTFTVINKLKTDIILTAGQFISADVPAVVHSFNSSSSQDKSVPDDSTVSVTTPRIYKPDEGYTVTVDINSPTAAQLSSAGNQYPQWITSQYLQLPSTLPSTVRRIAQNVVRNTQTPYGQVIAVRNYLSQFTYVESGTVAPSGADPVENFLTVQKAGNCTNFATAAVVLLRSVGVPARLCTGYIPHLWDKSSGTFIVEARDYHAWPEVYFPGYGWVEFEVTPNSTPQISAADSNVGDNSSNNNPADLSYLPSDSYQVPAASDSGTAASSPENSGISLSTIVFILLATAAAVALGVTINQWSRRYRRENYAAEAYAKMGYFSSWVRLPLKAYQTPLEYSHTLINTFPEKREAISRVTQAYMDSRFSRDKSLDAGERVKIRRSLYSIFWSILKRRLTSI